MDGEILVDFVVANKVPLVFCIKKGYIVETRTQYLQIDEW